MNTVGIIGGTGYTGIELVRLLSAHPDVKLAQITSRQNAGRTVAEVFPHLAGHVDLVYGEKLKAPEKLDVVFIAAVSGVAMELVPELLKKGVKIIDLSADFRIKNADVWARWYELTHACPQLLNDAVYGLPELYRNEIKNARLIANPGCYPTSVILGYAPLLKAQLIAPQFLVADSKSGVSGAGRQAQTHLLSAEVEGNFMAYAASGHRHFPEIAEQLHACVGDASSTDLAFTPHLVPMPRGIFSTLYVKTTESADALHKALSDAWASEPFVKVLPPGTHPQTRDVRGTNECHIAVHKQDNSGNSEIGKVLVVIDNLIKGAAGQAVQNMNLMCGLDETAGLKSAPVVP